jgi:O-antigen/teichoic acid export membrane protein
MMLARLLAPADFGLVAVAGAAFAIAALFIDLGMAGALIHLPDPPRSTLSTLFWLNQAAGLLLMLLFMAFAWPVSMLYDEPALLPVMLAMSLAMPLSALGQQFLVLAEKNLLFSTVALIEVVATASAFAVALAVALWQGGAYALVAAMLVSATVSSALAWTFLSAGKRPRFQFDVQGTLPYLRYGAYRMGEGLAMSVRSQLDVLIGGAVAGSAAMGIYTLPRNLALQLASALVNPIVTRVGLPVMARLQEDVEALKSIYLRTLRVTSAVNFPVYAALFAWSEEIVLLLLGDQWREAGPFLRLFALWAMILSTGNPVGSLLYATGHVRRAFWWNLAQLMIAPGILWFGASLHGIRGLAVSMVGMQLVLFYPLFRFLVRPACGARFGEYVGELLPALLASVCAVALGFAVSLFVSDTGWVRVSIGGGLAAAAYLALSSVINKPWLAFMSELLGPVRKARR